MLEAGQESARLMNLVEVERRFRRSVNLDRDAGAPDALNGYVVTPAVRRALSLITRMVSMTHPAIGRGAWSAPTGRARAHSRSSWPICSRRAVPREEMRRGDS